MIPGLPGRDIPVKSLLPFDRIILQYRGSETVRVTNVRTVQACWSEPGTIVVDWAGEGNVTGCSVFPEPETPVFLLAGPAPVAQAAAA